MKYVSLFSGIEAATVAWEPLGWEPLAFSEIDAFPCAVLAERFPGVPNLGDITKVDWSEYRGAVELVVGGSPCQAFSIAGLRDGLKDPRGNLMLEWLRVVDEIKPEFALWENVPGVLSDKTGAFRTLLDSLQSLGYIIDMDILDAQYFGVAQRRKRVFVLGWRAEILLKRKTSISRTITAQILGKILLGTLEGLLAESEKGHASSECAESSRDGLLKRMKSLGLRTEEDLLTWLKSLEEEKGRLALELKNLATPLGTKSRDMLDTEATSVFERMENERSFTELLWRTISDETSEEMNAYTTSTSTSLTTRSRIFICSTAGLIIARLMSHWKQLDRVYCNEGLYILTLLKEFTSYAIRENERADLFNGFDDVLAHIGREAERQEKIVRDLGNECGREIQLEPESLRWDFGSSREKRKAIAAGAEGGARAAGFKFHQGSGAGSIGYEDEVSPTLIADWHNPAVLQAVGNVIGRKPENRGHQVGIRDPETDGALTLTSTDRHAVIAPTAKTLQVRCGKEGGGKGALVQDDLSATLSTSNVQTLFKPVAFAANQRGEARLQGGDGDVTGSVPASRSGKQVNGVVCGYEVRRLTPRECERLQGLPTQVRLKAEEMTSDELIACALANGDITCDLENGKVYGTRGPGGKPLAEKRELGFVHPSGYVHIKLSSNGVKKQVRAHRVIYMAANGHIPDGMVIDHINNDKSDNRICNLQLLTAKENSKKAADDGLYLCGEDNPRSKITAEVRSRIAHDYCALGMTYRELAQKYGVSKSRIGQIINECDWTKIPYRGKPADECPDGPRYKAIGNSMAVPVMRWIGERIEAAERGEL